MLPNTGPRRGVLDDLTNTVQSAIPSGAGAPEHAWTAEGDVLRDLLGDY